MSLLLLSQSSGFVSRLVRTQNFCDNRLKASSLILKSNEPEVVSFDNEPDEGDQSDEKNMAFDVNGDEVAEGTSGQFRIKKTKPVTILNGELPPPPIFRGAREPAPITDNLVVVGLTILGLAGAVGFFLFLNKVRATILMIAITMHGRDNPTNLPYFSPFSSSRIYLPLLHLLR
jgi:hypothetical protein